ncbi:hypothetical protein KOW79_006946 [Hemibagrus wyckioides]|uniref:Uncharacterized protein n=1 Tax=Hemibagrus wyckioides TaxID=337641 RepID=A0A9D3NXN1_9TELE|nr:hypothetical protein KOW79_006946 [Hemibagrus wyckioides]
MEMSHEENLELESWTEERSVVGQNQRSHYSASTDLFSKAAITVLHSRLLSSPESLRGLGTSADPQSLHSVFTDL